MLTFVCNTMNGERTVSVHHEGFGSIPISGNFAKFLFLLIFIKEFFIFEYWNSSEVNQKTYKTVCTLKNGMW